MDPVPLPGTLAEFAARHEITILPSVEGVWRCWIPDGSSPGGFAGTLVHGRDEADLLARLIAELGG